MSEKLLVRYECDAYTAVLKAFATHPSLDWNKESILGSLRKELNITADIEQEIKDDVLQDLNLTRLREVREKLGGGEQVAKKARYSAPPVPHARGGLGPPAPTTSRGGKSSRKSKKSGRKAPPPAPPPQPAALPPPPAPAAPVALKIDEYIGRKVKRWWPDDGGWVEGVVTDFHEPSGSHVICYDMGTPTETFEYFNIRAGSANEVKILGSTVDLSTVSMLPPSASGQARPGGGRIAGGKHPRGAARAEGNGTVGPDTDLAAEVAATGITDVGKLERLKAELISREDQIRAELDKLNAASSSSDDDSDESSSDDDMV